MKKHVLWSVAAATLLFTACNRDNDEQDLTAPSIHNFEMRNAAGNTVRQVAQGESITFSATVNDETELREFKLDVHGEFDGHAHRDAAHRELVHIKIIPISGTEAQISEVITFEHDDNTPVRAGIYHAVAKAIDASGNEAAFRLIEFTVTNQVMPLITVTGTNMSGHGGHFHALQGSTVQFMGEITARGGSLLEHVKVYKKEKGHHGHHSHSRHGDHDNHFGTKVFDSGEIDAASFNLADITGIVLPMLDAGEDEKEIELTIMAEDSNGNIAFRKFEIHVERE
ncbi:MAG: DUF4625 domain-containing protein [Luteibaculaceae bacterium]